MPEERIIPAVESVAEFKIKIDGNDLPRTVEVIHVHVSKTINKIARAKIVIKDGDVADSDFMLSKGNLFLPGNQIEITAGSPDKQTAIFSGLIIKQSLSIRGDRASQLIIECRHKAVKATVVRRSKAYHETTDDEAISKSLKASGLSDAELDIGATTVRHPEMVQYNCTDWDFAVSRAEAAGMIVLTNADKIEIKVPDLSASASLSLLFGATIIELDAEMDSQTQFKSVKAKTWDMASQSLYETTATEPAVSAWGNIDGSELAVVTGQEEYLMQHGGSITKDEVQAWADASLLKSRLAKIRGRVKFEGIATINAGDILELYGLGDRFNGNAFVSGVRHDYSAYEGWKTQAQFGHSPEWFIDEPEVQSQKAGGMLPGTRGLHTGIVTDNEDPEGEFRVRVKIPFINPDDEGVWSRVALADAGNERGLFFRPEINDEVLVGFLFDDPRQPVILGMLHSSALAAPVSGSNDNHIKGYTSREKLVLLFNDEKKSIAIETPGGNKITLSDESKGITLEDQNGNKIKMDDQGIVIQATTKLELKAGAQLVIGGPQFSVNADSSLELKGGSTSLQSSGVVTIKGSMVKIN
jgi:Rhs element Vgr protein